MTSAYRQTTVPIARSQEGIRKLLIKFGVGGVQFAEDFIEGMINVRFAKRVGEDWRTVSVTYHACARSAAPETWSTQRKIGAGEARADDARNVPRAA